MAPSHGQKTHHREDRRSPYPRGSHAQEHPHGSIARNHRICEALFLARYIEKYGTGTLMMIRESLAHALLEPDFTQRGGEFTITLWRDWLTADMLAKLQLNDRQLKGLTLLRAEGRLTNGKYQELTGISRQAASRDLDEMVKKGILNRYGDRRGAFYGKAKKMPQL